MRTGLSVGEPSRYLVGCLVLVLLLSACAPPSIFPPEVWTKIDRTATFENLVTHPDHYKDRIVELGGQIVGSLTEEEQVYLLVRELPIRTTSLYGPFDTGRLNGMFVIRYVGEALALTSTPALLL